MKFCTKCGNKLEEQWSICPICSTPIQPIIKPEPKIIAPQQIMSPYVPLSTKRTKRNKKKIAITILLVVSFFIGGISLGFLLTYPSVEQAKDNTDYWNNEYNILLDDYQIITGDYDTLFNNYEELQSSYNTVCSVIKQSILPVQYCIFAEAVRRYYIPIYLEGLSGKSYWMGYAEFSRDIVLHDSGQYNAFSDVSDAFSDALKYGSDTMELAYQIMWWTFYPWLPNWDGFGLYGDEFNDINTIVDWCIDEIDYESDSDITGHQTYFDYDYIKFPVETVFRTMGDCEDQTILTAAYLESCGYETAISFIHDPSHPIIGDFYHSALLVHIEDTDAFYSMFPDGMLLAFPEIDPYYPPDFTWCLLDTTWDIPFGSIPSWLQDYIDFGGMSEDMMSDAICDINGGID